MTGLPASGRAKVGRAAGTALRGACAALLGAAMALLVSCSGSGRGLIPTARAGPLRSDFEAVERAARSAHGSCAATEAALEKTKADFEALPGSVDAGLRARLREGIAKLDEDARELCAQPSVTTSATSTSTPTTVTTPTTSQTTTHTATTNTATTNTATTPGGGTPAGEEAEGEPEKQGGKHKGKDSEESPSGGAPAGSPEVAK